MSLIFQGLNASCWIMCLGWILGRRELDETVGERQVAGLLVV